MTRLILLIALALTLLMLLFVSDPPQPDDSAALLSPPEFVGPVPENGFFRREVLESQLPVLVEFSANWCGPCKEMRVELVRLETMLKGRLKIVEIDTDEHEDLEEYYMVTALPLLLLFKNGEPVGGHFGLISAKRLAALLEPHLN